MTKCHKIKGLRNGFTTKCRPLLGSAGMSYRAFPLLRGCPKGGGFRRVYLCLRIGRALFMPCLCLVYALFMGSMCLVCA